MKKEALLALIVLFGYFALEGYAAHHAADRMEPVYIYPRFVGAARAVERCGGHAPETQARFEHNLEIVRERAMRDLRESHPQETEKALEQRAKESAQSKRREIDAALDSEGCGGKTGRAQIRLYRIWAGKHLG